MNETKTEPTLSDVLPASTQEVVAKSFAEDFKSKLKLPKTANRFLVARAIDRVLVEKLTVTQACKNTHLVESEAVYVAAIVDEFRAWEAANKPAPKTEEAAS